MGKNFRIFCLIGISFVTFFSGLTQDEPAAIAEELMVLGSKSEVLLENFGGTAHIVTAEEIEAHQWRTLAEVLHHLPGVSLVRTGIDGGVTTVFLRGADSGNTLVLVDGTKLNDAADVSRAYDFSHLSAGQIERVELLLGPQSALYGSDASAGVINIVTKSGAEPFFQLGFENSDQQNSRFNAGYGRNFGWVDLAAGFEHYNSGGLSARNEPATINLEEDGLRNTNAHLNLGFDLGSNHRLEAGFGHTESDIDLDDVSGDDPDFRGDLEVSRAHLRFLSKPDSGSWSYGLYLNRSQTLRGNVNRKDSLQPDNAILSDFEGNHLNIEFRNSFAPAPWVKLVTGIAYEEEEGKGNSSGESAFGPFTSKFTGSTDQSSLFGQANFSWDFGLYANLGGRVSDHSDFGANTTYQGSVGYKVKATGTRVRAFFGTGYKAPSIFQLFSSFGNLELREETSESWELGLHQDLLDGRFQLGATYFENRFDDKIDFFFDPVSFAGFYDNIDRAETHGYEVFLQFRADWVNAKLTYDNLSAEDTSIPNAAVPLIRRFDNKVALFLDGKLNQKLGWNLEVLRYGEALDINFSTFQNDTLEKYTLLNAGIQWHLAHHFNLNLRGVNLSDENYVQVIGYNTYGRRIFLGIQYRR